ncbi:MAG: hypothetical protein ACLGIR_04495 [Actinomycetes bacterium]
MADRHQDGTNPLGGAGGSVGDVVEAEVAQFEHEVRRIAAGGWLRAVIGFALGALAGLAVALVVPRREGPRRRVSPLDRPLPFTGSLADAGARAAGDRSAE